MPQHRHLSDNSSSQIKRPFLKASTRLARLQREPAPWVRT
jgi:hypothetical protein